MKLPLSLSLPVALAVSLFGVRIGYDVLFFRSKFFSKLLVVRQHQSYLCKCVSNMNFPGFHSSPLGTQPDRGELLASIITRIPGSHWSESLQPRNLRPDWHTDCWRAHTDNKSFGPKVSLVTFQTNYSVLSARWQESIIFQCLWQKEKSRYGWALEGSALAMPGITLSILPGWGAHH